MTPDNRNTEPLDAILRRAMRDRPGPATPECADAESLAAYSDRSLATSERERLETHFADCMRCQLMLADIARADESARDVETASQVPWYRRWRIAIPALAAAAAVLVFIAIRRPPNEETQGDQRVAMAKQEAPRQEVAEEAAVPAPAPTVQAAAPAAQVAALASRPAASVPNGLAMNEVRPELTAKREALRMHHAAPAPTPAVAPAWQGAAPAPPPADAGRVVAIAPAAPVVESSSAAVGRPTASVSSELAMNQPQPAPKRAESMGAFSSQALHREAKAPVPSAMGALAGAAAATGAQGSSAETSGATAGTEVLMTGSVTWIIGQNGMVQRRDADGTLHIQHSGVSTDLVAASAPSTTVCWVVGRSGTIIRTTDGEHWELITSPSADNLRMVVASSAKDATITTERGQRFATTDGGATWHSQ